MPVYEYRCSKGHVYEKTEGFSAPSRQRCPQCKSMAQRQISMPAVIFKGSGFYSTDNRKGYVSNGSSATDTSTTGGDDGHGHSHGGEAKVEAATD